MFVLFSFSFSSSTVYLEQKMELIWTFDMTIGIVAKVCDSCVCGERDCRVEDVSYHTRQDMAAIHHLGPNLILVKKINGENNQILPVSRPFFSSCFSNGCIYTFHFKFKVNLWWNRRVLLRTQLLIAPVENSVSERWRVNDTSLFF